MGEVGLLLGLRGEAAPHLHHQNRVPISYELTPANVADLSLTEELLAEANLGGEVACKLLGDLAYRRQELEEELAESGIALVSSEASARRPGIRQQIEIGHLQPQANLRSRRDLGHHHARWAGRQDRSQDNGLHLRFSHQPGVGAFSRSHQGVMGMNLATRI